MQLTLTTIAFLTSLLTSTPVKAHLGLANPATYLSGFDNLPPLDPSGSNFPCAVQSFTELSPGSPPTLTPGSTSSINLYGTAVHGGGSCQVSITYDSPPTKSSIWKVLRSYEGGCPVTADGNLPGPSGDIENATLPPLDYTVPEGLPSGQATIAWTWFNRVGNREMYMRCHKANVAGDSKDNSVLDKLPDMFVANLATTTCKTTEGGNLKFPNPGEDKRGNGDTDPVCGAGGAKVRRSAVRFSKEHLERALV